MAKASKRIKKKDIKYSGISVRLLESDIRKLTKIAHRANMPRSVYVRKFIKDHLDEVCNDND